jgi:hypothetical protein
MEEKQKKAHFSMFSNDPGSLSMKVTLAFTIWSKFCEIRIPKNKKPIFSSFKINQNIR